MGYGPGDEVIVPAQTHIATAHAVFINNDHPFKELLSGEVMMLVLCIWDAWWR